MPIECGLSGGGVEVAKESAALVLQRLAGLVGHDVHRHRRGEELDVRSAKSWTSSSSESSSHTMADGRGWRPATREGARVRVDGSSAGASTRATNMRPVAWLRAQRNWDARSWRSR